MPRRQRRTRRAPAQWPPQCAASTAQHPRQRPASSERGRAAGCLMGVAALAVASARVHAALRCCLPARPPAQPPAPRCHDRRAQNCSGRHTHRCPPPSSRTPRTYTDGVAGARSAATAPPQRSRASQRPSPRHGPPFPRPPRPPSAPATRRPPPRAQPPATTPVRSTRRGPATQRGAHAPLAPSQTAHASTRPHPWRRRLRQHKVPSARRARTDTCSNISRHDTRCSGMQSATPEAIRAVARAPERLAFLRFVLWVPHLRTIVIQHFATPPTDELHIHTAARSSPAPWANWQ